MLASARNFVDRRLTQTYVRFICLLVLSVYLVVFLVSFSIARNGRTVFGPNLGADFAAFYVAGKIFNTHSPAQIYNSDLQDRLYREQFPDAPLDSHLPYVNAPFFLLPFTLLARLPYPAAYVCWVVISLSLYFGGLWIMRTTFTEIPADNWLTIFLLALSFMPFLVECLAGGQTSAVGFFCLAAAIACERRGRFILSGLALSICTYKPTLLLLILPMLLVTRRYQTLLGFIVGCFVLALTSLLSVGWQGGAGFISTLLYFTSASTSAMTGLRTWKYVDVNSFFRLLVGEHVYLRWALTAAAFVLGLPLLFRLWWQTDRESREQQALVWAVTIAATLVLNVYVGIYDSTLVVLSALIITTLVYHHGSREVPAGYKLILVLLYVVPWITQPIARLTGVQLLTIVLAGFVVFQLGLTRNVTGKRESR